MAKNMVIKLACSFLSIFFVAGCTGKISTEPMQTTATHLPQTTASVPALTTRYNRPLVYIRKENGQYLLDFWEGNVANSSVTQVEYPQYSSVAEMKAGIMSGQFKGHEANSIKLLKKNKDGSILICDLDNLFEFSVPDGMKIDHIGWYGQNYAAKLSDSAGDFRVCTQEQYDEMFEKEFVNPLSQWRYYHVVSETQDPDKRRTDTVYEKEGKYRKIVRYTFDVGGSKRYVVEQHSLQDPNNFSKTVLHSVFLFGHEHGQPFYIELTRLDDSPMVGWLSQFALTPYVGNM